MQRVLYARAATASLLTVIAVTGCSMSTPSRSPTVASTPSEDEILAEAVDVYARYSAGLDAVLAEGNGDFSSLSAVATPPFIETLADGDVFTAKRWRTTGSTSFDSARLVSAGDDETVVQLCRDVSRVRIVDAAGADVTPPDREGRFPVVVTFQGDNGDETLKIKDSQSAPEEALCD